MPINDWEEVPVDDWEEVPVQPQLADQEPSSPGYLGLVKQQGQADIDTLKDYYRKAQIIAGGANRAMAGLLSMPGEAVRGIANAAGAKLESPNEWATKNLFPAGPKPEGLMEQTLSAAGEVLPSFVMPPVAQAAKKGVDIAKAAWTGIKAAAPVIGMSGAAKTIAPENPLVDLGAQLIGSAVGGRSFPKPSSIAEAERSVVNFVKQGFNKGVSYGVAKARNIPQSEKYYQKAADAVTDIVSKKNNITLTNPEGITLPNGTVPKTNYQFAQAIDQGKRQVWKEIDDMMQSASGNRIEVDTSQVVKELRAFADEPWLRDKYPSLAQKALDRAELLESRGRVDLKYVEGNIEDANKKLEALYRNPHPDSASGMAIENLEAMQWRRALDDTITATEGPGFQSLKNKYGSYKEIEQDVMRRATVANRARPYGFFGYGDILSGGEMASAFAHLSMGNVPGAVTAATRGAALHGIKQWITKQNAPDTFIERMFKNVDKAVTQYGRKGDFTPSPTGDLMTPDHLKPHTPRFHMGATGVPAIAGKQPGLPTQWQRPPGQAVVPTGIKRSYFPREAPIEMPSNAEDLLRHPMGGMSLVPMGPTTSFPARSALPITPDRVSIAQRRMVPGLPIREPSYTPEELAAAIVKLHGIRR